MPPRCALTVIANRDIWVKADMSCNSGAERGDIYCGTPQLLLLLLRIKEDGNVVGGERAFASSRAGADYGLMVSSRGEATPELTRNRIQAGCCVAHDEPGLTRTCIAGTHHAGLAGIVGGLGDAHS